MLVAGAMIAPSIFFVFRPHRPSTEIQLAHRLAGTACEAPPETVAMPPGYGLRETMIRDLPESAR